MATVCPSRPSANAVMALAMSLALSGCVAAAAEGLALESVAARGAMGAMVSRAAVGAVARSAVVEVGASRLLVSDPLVGLAARRGVLSSALYRLTGGGTRIAELSIERSGLIRAGGERLATLETSGGRIVAGGRVHGIVNNGIVYEYGPGGEQMAIARLRGFLPSRGISVTRASDGSQVFVLQRNVFVDVLEINNGFYLIRLPGGHTEWIGAEFVALAMIAAADDDRACPEGAGVLVRTSGLAIPFDQCWRGDGVYQLQTPEGAIVIDGLDVTAVVPGKIDSATSQGLVRFTGGQAIYGNLERAGDVVRVVDERGGITIADSLRVDSTTS